MPLFLWMMLTRATAFSSISPIFLSTARLKSVWVTTIERIVTLEEGQTLIENFANVQLSVVTAKKYRDDDLDGQYDAATEPLLDGWRITLWKQVDGGLWADMGSGYTANGQKSFYNLEPGTYRVDETLQSGWVNVTALSQYVTVAAGGVQTVHFGNVADGCSVQGPTSIEPGAIATFQNRYGYAGYDWQIVDALGQPAGTVIQDNGSILIWQAPDTVDNFSVLAEAWTLAEAKVKCSLDIEVEPKVIKLQLTSMCSDDPAVDRNWRVRNSNPFNVTYTWQVVGTGQTGTLVAAPGDNFFTTLTASGANTTKIKWQDENEAWQETVKASSGERCAWNPVVTLTGAEICSGDSTVLTALTDQDGLNMTLSYAWSTGETTQSITVDEAGSIRSP